jgi:hypothetical protein
MSHLDRSQGTSRPRPRRETAGPAPGRIHPRDNSVFAAHMPYQIYRTVDQHPPEIGMLTLVEELDARLNGYLGAVLEQIAEVIIGEPIEDAQ